jgi:hypothetical protein
MGRSNSKIEGVFNDLVGSDSQISQYDKFLNYVKGSTIDDESDLSVMVGEYEKLINKNKNALRKLAKVEEIILQLRSIEDTDDIKLSLVREYVYARCPFFRQGKTSKDIRVIVDKVDDWGGESNFETLQNNHKFMTKAISKLKHVMEEEVKENIYEFKKLK